MYVLICKKTGNPLPPIDDDGTDVFLCWPTKDQALQGLDYQADNWLDGDKELLEVIHISELEKRTKIKRI